METFGDTTGKTDYRKMNEALMTDGDLVLKECTTYYIKGTIYVESNQSITATGEVIIFLFRCIS